MSSKKKSIRSEKSNITWFLSIGLWLFLCISLLWVVCVTAVLDELMSFNRSSSWARLYSFSSSLDILRTNPGTSSSSSSSPSEVFWHTGRSSSSSALTGLFPRACSGRSSINISNTSSSTSVGQRTIIEAANDVIKLALNLVKSWRKVDKFAG